MFEETALVCVACGVYAVIFAFAKTQTDSAQLAFQKKHE